MKTAFVTGITGQDGAYLANLLLEHGIRVVGAVRRSSSPQLGRLEELGIAHRVELIGCELLEASNIRAVLNGLRPDVVFNLAAQSFVGASFEQPVYTTHVNAIAVAHLLEAIRECCPETRFYQASTSEMFGHGHAGAQNEDTPFHPRSPYAVSKLYAHWMTVNYREAYGLHATSGILFNHESPLRGREFVTRKITHTLAQIRAGREEPLALGNLDAKRDWGYAPDFVEGMWRMVNHPQPETFVLATGVCHSVREFATLASRCAGYDLAWDSDEAGECGRDRASGRKLIVTDPRFSRPNDVQHLIGDASRAKSVLDWSATTTFESLVERMVSADVDRLARGASAV